MPELPEIEVTRRGIAPVLTGQRASAAVLRAPTLRYPLPADLSQRIGGQTLIGIQRRGKYLLLDFGAGTLLLHLGMSGSVRLVAANAAAQKHDHVDLVFGDIALRLNDPRRFGALLWLAGDPLKHPLLASLGVEPLTREFSGAWLAAQLKGRSAAIKPSLMDANLVVGVGNIYAAESLFLAGIDPRRAAGRISLARLTALVSAIKITLRAAIRAGGSSLRDFSHHDGALGCFQTRHRVYDRAGLPCVNCGALIRSIRQAQRSTWFCPRCQK